MWKFALGGNRELDGGWCNQKVPLPEPSQVLESLRPNVLALAVCPVRPWEWNRWGDRRCRWRRTWR